MVSDYIGHIITFASLTHDGQCYVLSCNDETVRLFDKDSGKFKRFLEKVEEVEELKLNTLKPC